MWITEKISHFCDDWNSEADQFTDSFIGQTYYGMVQLSLMYMRIDSKHRVFSFIQFMAFYFVLGFHFYLLSVTSFSVLSINFTIFTHNTHILVLTALVSFLVFNHQMNRKHFIRLHRMMAHDFYDYQEPELEEFVQIRAEMMRQRRMMFVVPASVLVSAGAVLSLSPIVDRYGTFDFGKMPPLTCSTLLYPFGVYPYSTKDGAGYYVSFVLQLIFVLMFIVPIATTGYAYMVVSQSLLFQLRILLASLDNLEKRAVNLRLQVFDSQKILTEYNLYEEREFVYCYDKCLRKNFEHHQILIRFFHSLGRVFSVTIFLSYSVGTLVIALSLLCTGSRAELPGTTVAAGFLCFTEVGFMYLFSIYGQNITDLSMELNFKMYSTKWYHCNANTTKGMAIFQKMTLKPMALVAAGIVPVNMDTFGKVMNSAYSYYNVVNVFNK